MKNLFLEIVKLGTILMVVCAVAAGALGLTYAYTAPVIAEQERKGQEEKNQEVIKIFAQVKDVSLSPKEELVEELKAKFPELEVIFEIISGEEVVGAAVKISPRGYGGPVVVAVGFDLEGNIVGVKVLDASKETAGIGNKVMTDEIFLGQFAGKKVSDPLEVKKDVDAISGATISSKAVVRGVKDASQIFIEIMKAGK